MNVRFELRRDNRSGTWPSKGSNRYTLWAVRVEDGIGIREGRISINRFKMMAMFPQLEAFIDKHKTEQRPAAEIIAELGIAQIMLESELGGEVTT